LTSLAALVAMVSAGGARADTITIFNDFSGPGFNQFESLGVGDYSVLDVVFAMQFTSSSTVDLADAMLALGNYAGSNSPITVDLESDDSGAPGIVLATLTQQGTIPQYYSPGLVTFDYSGTPVQLNSGSTYWLVALETDPNSQQAWFLSNDAAGLDSVNYVGSATGPWTAGCPPGPGCSDSLAAFQVDGTTLPIPSPPIASTPEPSSLSLLGFLLMISAAIVGRRRITRHL